MKDTLVFSRWERLMQFIFKSLGKEKTDKYTHLTHHFNLWINILIKSCFDSSTWLGEPRSAAGVIDLADKSLAVITPR